MGGSDVAGEDGGDASEDFLERGEPADALIAAGQGTGGGPDQRASVLLELLEVALGCRVQPHLAIHGRGDEHRGAARQRQIDRSQRVGCQAMGEFSDHVGRGRRDE